MKFILNRVKLVNARVFASNSKRKILGLTSKAVCKIAKVDYHSIGVGVFDGEFKAQKKAG